MSIEKQDIEGYSIEPFLQSTKTKLNNILGHIKLLNQNDEHKVLAVVTSR